LLFKSLYHPDLTKGTVELNGQEIPALGIQRVHDSFPFPK
jgi:hypothetical protein